MKEDNEKNVEEKNKNTKKNKLIIKIILIIIAIILYTILVAFFTIRTYKVYLQFETNDKVTDNIEIEQSGEEENNQDITITEQNEEQTDNITTIKLKDKVKKDGKYEMTVVSYDFSKKVLPPNTSSYYTYYEAKEDGHQYLDIKIKYKNLDYTDIGADEVGSVSIKFDNKYEYTGFSVIEDTDKDFTYTNITSIEPLTEGNLHYLIDVPDEVAKGKEPITAFINIGNDKYKLEIRK
jgi:hypothetical protein